jgi:hypothetical protein
VSISERAIVEGEIERHYLHLDAVVCFVYECQNGERHLLISESLRDKVESGRILLEALRRASDYR